MTTETSDNSLHPRALVVGLGNPGTAYASHRHNIGFRVIDALAKAHSLRFVRQKYTRAHVAEGQICGSCVILAKPQTFMNSSGKAVSRLCRQYEVGPQGILVVYDDLDLPLGRLRLRREGGSGGHRGMLSIIEQLGTRDFARLRVGIDRPTGRMDPAEYVLQPFDQEEESWVSEVVEMSVGAIESWVTAGIVVAMDRFNRPLLGEDQDHTALQPQVDTDPCSEGRNGPRLEGSGAPCPERSVA